MDNNFFDTDEMEALLQQLNSSTGETEDSIISDNSMSKEMEASQKRYEEYIKKHSEEKA